MSTDSSQQAEPLLPRDAAVVIGLLAELEGSIIAGDVPNIVVRRVSDRFFREGLIGANADQGELVRVIGDLNQRVRYAAGETAVLRQSRTEYE